jgi:hypothetical protein
MNSKMKLHQPILRRSAAIVAMAVVASPGVAVAAMFTPKDFASQPATAIVASASRAMNSESSVIATFSAATRLPIVGQVIIHETNYLGQTSGSQILRLSYPSGRSGAALPAGTTLNVKGALYMNGNAAFWEMIAHLSATSDTRVANRWIRVAASDSIYHTAIADTTISSGVEDLFHAKTYKKGLSKVVSGALTSRSWPLQELSDSTASFQR